MGNFIPGLKLSELFFDEAVKPILAKHYPSLEYSAGLIGPGSEVLGFDTLMSTDHDWGPRVLIFLTGADHRKLAHDISKLLSEELPFTFQGYPTHFVKSESDSFVAETTNKRPINHKVEVSVLSDYIRQHTGIDINRRIELEDWLVTPEQCLRSLVAGKVFLDKLNILVPMRERFSYYPNDLWLYLLSSQWLRIGQEEPVVGRTGIVGDEIGSAIIANRLVRDLMRLCFLMEKQYAPYSKWFGTAFTRLKCAKSLNPVFEQIIRSENWQNRERHLTAACRILIRMHNTLGITPQIQSKIKTFHNRPFKVIGASDIADSIWSKIKDEEVKALPFGVGKIDQIIDSTDILSYPKRTVKLKALYQ